MNEVFTLHAQIIYSAIDNGHLRSAMEAISLAGQVTDRFRRDDADYIPSLIYGEFFHLFSGAHSDLYTPKRGYYPITEQRSALSRIGHIQAHELGDSFLDRVPQLLESDIAVIPQITLSDIMILMADDVHHRLELAYDKEAEIRRLNREREDLEYMRGRGYEPLEENTRAQNLFEQIRWSKKEY